MKFSILLCFLVMLTTSYGQLFHFDQDSVALVKNTDQSPAHWYLEIISDCATDTTLRWKAHFVNIPAQWNINFDDQNMFYTTVLDGDSADFTLYSGLSFPQKLIIGAEFNGTPGDGSILFDIYDPDTPQDFVTIEYHYIVGQASLDELGSGSLIYRKGDYLYFAPQLEGGTLQIINIDGSVIAELTIESSLKLPPLKGEVFYRAINENIILNYREHVD